MPSPKKSGHTRVLVQIPDATHARADAKRRGERVTWARVIATLLSRWAAGEPIEGPVRARRLAPIELPLAPVAVRASRTPGERVVIPGERWHRSPIAAVLIGAGKDVPADLPALEGDDQDLSAAG
jgi:hypothetical protein